MAWEQLSAVLCLRFGFKYESFSIGKDKTDAEEDLLFISVVSSNMLYILEVKIKYKLNWKLEAKLHHINQRFHRYICSSSVYRDSIYFHKLWFKFVETWVSKTCFKFYDLQLQSRTQSLQIF